MNLPTIIVLVILAVILGAIVYSEIKKRKNGGCGCGCQGCSLKDTCHNKKSSKSNSK